jgi:hypothetical protein
VLNVSNHFVSQSNRYPNMLQNHEVEHRIMDKMRKVMTKLPTQKFKLPATSTEVFGRHITDTASPVNCVPLVSCTSTQNKFSIRVRVR